jgi:hypothetical protein
VLEDYNKMNLKQLWSKCEGYNIKVKSDSRRGPTKAAFIAALNHHVKTSSNGDFLTALASKQHVDSRKRSVPYVKKVVLPSSP